MQSPLDSEAVKAAERGYREAFQDFSKQVRIVQLLQAQPNPDRAEIDRALIELAQAHHRYHARREVLALYFLPHPEANVGERHVPRVAQLLWEVAGKPDGSASEDWRRAEDIVRSSAAA